MEPQLVLPRDWDELAAFEVENKGWYRARIVFDGCEVSATFYDPANLAIDVELDIKAGRHFVERNLIVVLRVTAENMSIAAANLPPGFFELPQGDC